MSPSSVQNHNNFSQCVLTNSWSVVNVGIIIAKHTC